MRVRGGIEYNPNTEGWRLVVHPWHADQGLGAPDAAYAWPMTYATEAEAKLAYTTHARPAQTDALRPKPRKPTAKPKDPFDEEDV